MTDAREILTTQQAAKLCRVTTKTIQVWIREGLPVVKRGEAGAGKTSEIELRALFTWYLDHVPQDPLDAERTRLAREQADKQALDNAERRGDLADLTAVARVWAQALGAFRARMLAAPSKLAPSVNPENPNLARDVIDRELSEILDELAGTNLRAIASERGATARGSAADPAVAAKVNGKPVGRPRKAPQSRKQRGTRALANQ